MALQISHDGSAELLETLTSGVKFGIEVFRATSDVTAFLAGCDALAASFRGEGYSTCDYHGYASKLSRKYGGPSQGCIAAPGERVGFDGSIASVQFESGNIVLGHGSDAACGSAGTVGSEDSGGGHITADANDVDVPGGQQSDVVSGECVIDGALESSRGKHYRKNQRKKERRRARSQHGNKILNAVPIERVGSWIEDRENRKRGSCAGKDELRESLERKWKIENELAAERASRALAVLKGNDVEGEIRRYRTRVAVQSERNMVGVEKAHAVLKATGNVPSLAGGGFAETVVSGEPPSLSSGSISPNSSASMAEFRAQQKALLDLQADFEVAKKALARFNYSIEAEKNIDKQTFTDDTEGNALLGQLDTEYGGIHYVEREGVMKMKKGPNNDIWY